MNVTVRLIGPQIVPAQRIALGPESPTIRDVARALIDRYRSDWKHIIKADLSPAENYALLLNGRNVMSLEGLDTRIHEDDELVFTVQVTGG